MEKKATAVYPGPVQRAVKDPPVSAQGHEEPCACETGFAIPAGFSRLEKPPGPPFTAGRSQARPTGEPALIRWLLITIALVFLALFLVVPLAAVFVQALEKGLGACWDAIREPDTVAAIRLTLLTAAIAVPLNLLFGLAGSWTIAKFDFFGKNVLITLIDLPFAVSPVISGMIFVLLFGAQGWLGPWLEAHNLKLIFAVPGIVLATIFVTFPFVARELIPLMQAQGIDEEQAALVLGANGWQTFWRVTLPNVRWALLYGVILCNARAMGEFGAVSVVSGHIRGLTNTMPLHVEILYNEYNFVAAFAVASLLALLALVTLVAKNLVEWRSRREMEIVTVSEGTGAEG
jgi:sulfate transport system permease protein